MKITKVEFVGIEDTYAIEMGGAQHNYTTATSGAIHKNSHAVSYCLTAYKCLWLKAHFPAEWWASVMSYCHPDKLPRYMAAAREDGVEFGSHDIGFLTENFTSDGKSVNLGLACLKRVGNKLAGLYADTERQEYTDIDDFIAKKCAQSGSKTINKVIMERLIRLGAFKKLHPNARATWEWFQYKYVKSKEMTAKRKEIQQRLLLEDGWTDKKIEQQRADLINNWRNDPANKRKKKVPDKLLKWYPTPVDTRERVMGLVTDDYSIADLLAFEKEYLGYVWHSPLLLYNCNPDFSVARAKNASGTSPLHCVVMQSTITNTKAGSRMLRAIVMDTTGAQALLLVWEDQLAYTNGDGDQVENLLQEGRGIHAIVQFNDKRGSFTLANPDVRSLSKR